MNERETTLSVVVSVYNEEAALPDFYRACSAQLRELGCGYEMLFVNDGSRDASLSILKGLAEQDGHVALVSFSRNFGHEAAMIAGIDHARGDLIVCMDADLQHPVETLPEILGKYREGYDVISMARTKNKDAGLIKNVTSSAFYWLINAMSDSKMEKNASDFFGISRRVAEVLKKDYRERVRFLRGYVQNVGFRKTVLEYEAADRVAGRSKYSIRKLMRFSLNTIMCFSSAPLRLGIYAGAVAALLGFVMAVYTVISWASVGTPNGYATIIVLLCFMFAVLFFMIGIIGEYISVLFEEVKGRPVYIVEETVNTGERGLP